MKVKKKPKKIVKIISIVLIVLIIIISTVLIVKSTKKPEVKDDKPKIESTITEYGYSLKETKSKRYKTMFKELEKILAKKPINKELYAKKITELFIYDFYSLSEKTSKTDIGGVDFVHPNVLQNFLVNAQDTYYKYVESNIYGERIQKLPLVDTITIESIIPIEYPYNNEKKAGYEIKVSWTYTSQDFNDYQKSATLTLIEDGIKYHIVELH